MLWRGFSRSWWSACTYIIKVYFSMVEKCSLILRSSKVEWLAPATHPFWLLVGWDRSTGANFRSACVPLWVPGELLLIIKKKDLLKKIKSKQNIKIPSHQKTQGTLHVWTPIEDLNSFLWVNLLCLYWFFFLSYGRNHDVFYFNKKKTKGLISRIFITVFI